MVMGTFPNKAKEERDLGGQKGIWGPLQTKQEMPLGGHFKQHKLDLLGNCFKG